MDKRIAQLMAEIPAGILLTGEEIPQRHLHDWMEEAPAGTALALARPRNTEDVAQLLKACHRLQLPVVPQGGLTGLAGGAVPVPGCVLISLERLNGIEEIDTAANTLTVLAGTPLETVQQAAWEAGLFFPLDLGARGSCTIGGNLSTNAGGNRVLRYGMARDLVLGIEAVLADGTVISSLSKAIKNNTGYDLKQFFVGSEGTLGIITRAILRLHPQPRSTCTALCAVADYASVVKLLNHVRTRLGATLSAFELMWPDFYELVTSKLPGLNNPPLPRGHGAYVLIEAMGTEPVKDQEHFEETLGEILESGLLADAVIAQSGNETQALWRIRDASGELRQIFWPNIGFDVSIEAGRIGDFIEECRKRLLARWPVAQTIFFGHVGDANIHLAVRVGDQPPVIEVEDLVYECVGDWRGSISAEHGIGTVKRAYLHYSRSESERAMMQVLKRALDPQGILNPGKVLA